MAAFGWLVALTLRSTVVLLVALALGLLLRRAGAVWRHRLLTLTALGLLALPALPQVLPCWELALLPSGMETRPLPVQAPLAEELLAAAATRGTPLPLSSALPPTGRPRPALEPEGTTSSLRAALGTTAVIAWLVGVLASLAGLGRALLRETRLLASARPLVGPWLQTLAEARRALAVGRPVRLLMSEEIDAPLTAGWSRPAVLVPARAAYWPDETRRLVVQHELVHVVRGDGLRHLAWRLVAALYWFNPLARLAERHAGLVSEHACDEAVVGLGTRPSTYARQLLEIAESLRAQTPTFASALPMLERSQLERRLVMILDEDSSAGQGRAAAVMALALLATTVFGVGAASPLSPLVRARAQGVPDPAAKPVEAPRPATPAPAAEPVRAASAEPVCIEGISGSFTRSGREEASGADFGGVHDGEFSLQQHLGDGQRLCARVRGPVRFDEKSGAIGELPAGASVEIETRDGRGRSQRMLITAEQGEPRHRWWVNGAPHAVDDAARAWLKDALEVVAAYRAIGSIQGHVGSLQGEIGSIQGEIGSLQGQIGSIQGQEGSLQGKIGSIQGEQGSLEGAIGSHQGAIGSLEGSRWQASAALKEQIDREIKQHQAAIRKLEAEKESRGFSRRLAEAEEELRAFQQRSRGEIAELERKIETIRTDDGIGKLERQIQDLHAEDRVDEIKRRMAPVLERLKAQIRQLGS